MRSPVVCGIDGSPASGAAACLARIIAVRLSRPLELLHVSQLPDESERLAHARALRSAIDPRLADDAVLHVEIGAAPWRLIEASRRAAALVIGCHGGGAIQRALAGSVTAAVVRSATAPVIVVPRGVLRRGAPELSPGGVVCAVRDERDLAAAGTATCWARELGLSLTLTHVVPSRRPPVTPLGGPPPTGHLYGDRSRIWDARAMLGEMARAVAPNSPPECGSGVLVGAVSVELARLAAAEACALLIVGPARPSSAAWLFRRRTIAYLTRRARCPVLVSPSPETVLATSSHSMSGRPTRPDAGRSRRV